MSDGALRVALLHPSEVPDARDFTAALAARGHGVTVVEAHRLTAVDDRLQRHGFQPHLMRMPFTAAALKRERFELAHAFCVCDAAVAARWSSRTGRPAVFTVTEEPDRRSLANKRRRFDLLREVVHATSAFVAPDRQVAAACRRWLGVDAEVIDPRDAPGHEDLYRRLLR